MGDKAVYVWVNNEQKVYTKDYTFDGLSRIGNDSCGLSQKNIQNVASANYNLTNFFSQDCGMKRPIEFATSQPNIFYNGSHQVGMGGCNIDANSDLLIGTVNTHPKCRISLYERPFLTVPYLGRGSADVVRLPPGGRGGHDGAAA